MEASDALLFNITLLLPHVVSPRPLRLDRLSTSLPYFNQSFGHLETVRFKKVLIEGASSKVTFDVSRRLGLRPPSFLPSFPSVLPSAFLPAGSDFHAVHQGEQALGEDHGTRGFRYVQYIRYADVGHHQWVSFSSSFVDSHALTAPGPHSPIYANITLKNCGRPDKPTFMSLDTGNGYASFPPPFPAAKIGIDRLS